MRKELVVQLGGEEGLGLAPLISVLKNTKDRLICSIEWFMTRVRIVGVRMTRIRF